MVDLFIFLIVVQRDRTLRRCTDGATLVDATVNFFQVSVDSCQLHQQKKAQLLVAAILNQLWKSMVISQCDYGSLRSNTCYTFITSRRRRQRQLQNHTFRQSKTIVHCRNSQIYTKLLNV